MARQGRLPARRGRLPAVAVVPDLYSVRISFDAPPRQTIRLEAEPAAVRRQDELRHS
jgi:hypothetical protein